MTRLDPQTTPYGTQDPVHPTQDPMRDGARGAVPGGPPAGDFDPWSYREDAGITGADLVGYKVEATDGGIGKVDSASYEVNSSYLVVDTGPWIFGNKVMLPAGVVNHVDHDDQKVYVNKDKAHIKAAPEFDPDRHHDPAYREKLGGHYGDSYGSPGTTALPPQIM
ncbi:PRC-barrel domain containing protein [Polymorphospora rubra]|uniref:PRC-barrel domain containing protein n=1 Tax=Polymorphospora rubra TaxID=338584 RepID=UPI003F4CD076